jgi:hypothetical protein
MSQVRTRFGQELQQCDHKRKHPDCGPVPPPSISLMDSLQYIKDKAETQVHKDMQRMIDCFLEMPDSDDDLAVWYRRAHFRCAAAFASSIRARWPQLAAAYMKRDTAKNSPSLSVSSDDAEPFEFSNEHNLQTYTSGAIRTSTESSFWKISFEKQ